MHFRMGKGQVLVFDAFIQNKLEELRAKRGFYPTLKEIADNCIPPQSSNVVFRSLRRLAAAGRLSKEALQVYNAKNNLKYINTGESHDEKNSKSRKVKK